MLIFFNSVAMMALCSFCYGILQRKVARTVIRRVGTGLTFGIGAALVMFQPIDLGGGFQADARGAFISMAAAFGGPIAVTLASGLAIAARIQIGGAGIFAGCVVIVGTMALALLWRVRYHQSKKESKLAWLVMCLAATLPSITVVSLIGQGNVAVSLFFAAVMVVSILIFWEMLAAEQRRGRRERALIAAAATDSLTGLPNRRAFDEFAQSLEDSGAKEVLLLLIDVDHFKLINDHYGHDEGDRVLSGMGASIKRLTRNFDYAARIGGEEFAVIVRSPSSGTAEHIAERLRVGLQIPYGIAAEPRKTTVSIGAFCSGKSPFMCKQSYKAADQALYESKARGRDRVTVVARRSIPYGDLG